MPDGEQPRPIAVAAPIAAGRTTTTTALAADGGILGADETNTLERLQRLRERLSGPPDLLVVLTGDPLVLLERVRARGPPGEESYTLDDMRRLDAAYARWLGGWRVSPVIAVKATDHDLRDMTEIERLAAAVSQMVRVRGV